MAGFVSRNESSDRLLGQVCFCTRQSNNQPGGTLFRPSLVRLETYDPGCTSILGQGLFLELYDSLGHEVFRQGLLNLHTMSMGHMPGEYFQGECAGIDGGLCYFSAAFLSDMTPEQRAIAQEIIARRYYGTSP